MPIFSRLGRGGFLLFALATPAIAQPSPLLGRWMTPDNKTVVDIVPCKPGAGTVCAALVADNPPKGEPSRAGQTIGIGFKPAGGGAWKGSVLASDGSELPATLTMPHANQLDMEVCFMGLLCNQASYHRAGV